MFVLLFYFPASGSCLRLWGSFLQSGVTGDPRFRKDGIRQVQQALADSLAMLNEKAPNDSVLKLKSIQAMEKVADGKATKIIIPSEMQGLVGMANGIVESAKE